MKRVISVLSIIVNLLIAIILIASYYWVEIFENMFREFGNAEIPQLTQILLTTRGLPSVAGFIVIALTICSLVVDQSSVRTRKILYYSALFLGLLVLTFITFALYLPVFKLTGPL